MNPYAPPQTFKPDGPHERAFSVLSALKRSRVSNAWGLLIAGIVGCIDFGYHREETHIGFLGLIAALAGAVGLIVLYCGRRRVRRRLRHHPLVREGRSLHIAAGFARSGALNREGCLVLTRDEWVFSLVPADSERGEWATLLTLPHASISMAQPFPAIGAVCGRELLFTGPAIAGIRIVVLDPAPFLKAFNALKRRVVLRPMALDFPQR